MKKYIFGLGVVIGAVCGYLYWYFIGCSNGTCAITSSPVNSSLYGALLGYLTTTFFTDQKSQQ